MKLTPEEKKQREIAKWEKREGQSQGQGSRLYRLFPADHLHRLYRHLHRGHHHSRHADGPHHDGPPGPGDQGRGYGRRHHRLIPLSSEGPTRRDIRLVSGDIAFGCEVFSSKKLNEKRTSAKPCGSPLYDRKTRSDTITCPSGQISHRVSVISLSRKGKYSGGCGYPYPCPPLGRLFAPGISPRGAYGPGRGMV